MQAQPTSLRLTRREHERLTTLLETRREEGWTEEELEDLAKIVEQGAYMATFFHLVLYDTEGEYHKLDEEGEPIRVVQWYVEAEMRWVGRDLRPFLMDEPKIPVSDIEMAIVDRRPPLLLVHHDPMTNQVVAKDLEPAEWCAPFQ